MAGRCGRPAVLTAVTADFSRAYSVSAGDFLLAVNGVATSLLSASNLDNLLCIGSALASFEVISRLSCDENNQGASAARPQVQSKEQLSVSIHGFYAKGVFLFYKCFEFLN